MSDQHSQQYGWKGVGWKGNGLGNVWGGSGRLDATDERRRARPNNNPPMEAYVEDVEGIPLDADEPEDEPLGAGDLILLLSVLTPKQRFVIEMRYGLRDGVPYSLADISMVLGISHQAVDQLEQRALAALRRGLKSDVTGGMAEDSPGAESTLTGDAAGC